ncbi:hypothetical protein D1AOALGA4SA_6588 [Olavius algarvensis Delta 1 endosymbiont]|nr:hypothetical protein D1AOALGA4SA_6588 [Olavius algarvensis Delta 1 endosymbiont]
MCLNSPIVYFQTTSIKYQASSIYLLKSTKSGNLTKLFREN